MFVVREWKKDSICLLPRDRGGCVLLSAKEASPPRGRKRELRKMESFVVFLSDKKHEEGFTPLFCALFVLSSDKKNPGSRDFKS